MGSRIFKQPNGLYGRWSTIVDCPTHWNMTIDDYREYRLRLAKEEIEEDIEHIFKRSDTYCSAVDFDTYFKGKLVREMSKKEFEEFLKDIGSKLNIKEFDFYEEED